MYEIIETRFGHDSRRTIDTDGMDYDTAVEAMPRLYGVSFGNGNDGVSHLYPNFYVRTCEPYVLAAAAMLSDFKPGEGHDWCIANVEIDGEADYTIIATLYNPTDDREDYEEELKAAQEDLDEAQSVCDEAGDDDEAAQHALEQAEKTLEELTENDPGSWSASNGAWMICEVFPVDDDNWRRPVYTSLADAFTANLIEMAREV